MSCAPSAHVARGRFCRLCLRKSDTFLLPLRAKMDHLSVMDMLVAVTGIEFEEDDLYPTKVCTRCMTKLDFAYNVRQEFLNSSELLLKLAVENRLSAYYEEMGGKEIVETHADEILRTSRSVLEESAPGVEESFVDLEQLEEEDVEYVVQEVKQVEVHEVNEEPEVPPEPVEEKYVYSWRELVKPKRPKQPRKIQQKPRNKSEELQFPQTTCYICDTEHETLEQRDEHFEQHVPMVPHRCDLCSTDDEPVISKSVLTLNRHRLMHRLPYKCDHCYRRFISSGSQYTHVWSMHNNDPQPLTCKYCNKLFTQKRSYQAHVRRHRSKINQKYKCEVCGEASGSSLLLERHRRKHTGEKNFTCSYCAKSFSRACNLLTHKRIHTNERCHKCSDCGNSFRDSVTLRKHRERFHLGSNPSIKNDRNPYTITPEGLKQFTCKFEGCSYTTTSSNAMSRHKARHVKKYVCGVCGKRFAQLYLVRKHQASMHGDGKAPSEHLEADIAPNEELVKLEPVYEVEILEEECV